MKQAIRPQHTRPSAIIFEQQCNPKCFMQWVFSYMFMYILIFSITEKSVNIGRSLKISVRLKCTWEAWASPSMVSASRVFCKSTASLTPGMKMFWPKEVYMNSSAVAANQKQTHRWQSFQSTEGTRLYLLVSLALTLALTNVYFILPSFYCIAYPTGSQET